ncbi:MAG: T9SS type A sorting domain-containing protein [Bacteroidales bacterium]|nr:T9SS type A sorting domain-containing protein [Bacteroidales bacterium]
MYMAKKVKRLFFISNPRTIVVSTDVTYLAVFTDVVGIEDNGVSEIFIFPNPTNDILNITFSEIIFEIEIVNALGQVVKRLEVNADNAVCDVEDLTSGVYVVRINCSSLSLSKGAVVFQRKFVKE